MSNTPDQYLKWTFGALLTCVFMVFCFAEIRFFHITFDLSKFLWVTILTGTFLGGFIAYLYASGIKENLAKIQLIMLGLFIGAVFSPFVSHKLNRIVNVRSIEIKQYEFWIQEPKIERVIQTEQGPETIIEEYRTFIFRKHKMEVIKSDEILFPAAEKGDMIELPSRKGLFGFEYVVLPGK